MRIAALALAAVLVFAGTALAEPPEAARIGVSLQGFSRSFRYSDDYFGFLRNYAGGSPMLAVQGEVYPGAFFRNDLVADLGLYFGLSRSFGLESQRSDGLRFPTTYATREIGLAVRRRFGAHSIDLRFGYGAHRFAFENAGPARPGTAVTPDVPSLDYRFMRLGVEPRIRVVRELRIAPSFAYLPVFDTGGLGSNVWFPRVKTGGLTAGLEVAYRFFDALDVLASFEYRRFWSAFHPEVGDPFIAGGGLDQYYVVSLGARYVFACRRDAPGQAK